MRHVICFGNALHGDDGFGPAVHARLAQRALPPEWRAFDAGCRGLDALALFQCEEVIIVDAAAPAGKPGRLGRPAVSGIDMETSFVGHDAGVGYLLRALAVLDGQLPALRILTAEMERIAPFQPGLSLPMTRAVDEAVKMLRGWMQIRGEDMRGGEGDGSGSGLREEQ